MVIYHVEILADGKVLKGAVATSQKNAEELRLRLQNDPLADAPQATVAIRTEFKP